MNALVVLKCLRRFASSTSSTSMFRCCSPAMGFRIHVLRTICMRSTETTWVMLARWRAAEFCSASTLKERPSTPTSSGCACQIGATAPTLQCICFGRQSCRMPWRAGWEKGGEAFRGRERDVSCLVGSTEMRSRRRSRTWERGGNGLSSVPESWLCTNLSFCSF